MRRRCASGRQCSRVGHDPGDEDAHRIGVVLVGVAALDHRRGGDPQAGVAVGRQRLQQRQLRLERRAAIGGLDRGLGTRLRSDQRRGDHHGVVRHGSGLVDVEPRGHELVERRLGDLASGIGEQDPVRQQRRGPRMRPHDVDERRHRLAEVVLEVER
ncbi:hypothetical protein ESP62_005890 [Aeromicrobium fastidiosum]|uniref:Uncharacterized protein n=1 Tax=Aeromicrobium fastidiosum TaxID=52699 RepID=A0A641ARX4_9ACTN|nr:hypothetical protein ESP62_005890 [Aeromicrobium fastidiosum]